MQLKAETPTTNKNPSSRLNDSSPNVSNFLLSKNRKRKGI